MQYFKMEIHQTAEKSRSAPCWKRYVDAFDITSLGHSAENNHLATFLISAKYIALRISAKPITLLQKHKTWEGLEEIGFPALLRKAIKVVQEKVKGSVYREERLLGKICFATGNDAHAKEHSLQSKSTYWSTRRVNTQATNSCYCYSLYTDDNLLTSQT